MTTLILAGIFGSFLSIGCAISSQLRCTTLLTFPTMCGRGGRGAFKALIIAYILAGPVENLTQNAKEVVRSFACTGSLSYNITKQKYSLMYKPFVSALMGLKADTSEVKDTVNALKDVIQPITNEITDYSEVDYMREENNNLDDAQNVTRRSQDIETKYANMNNDTESERVEEVYFKKLEYRCENVLTAAVTNCRKLFVKAFDDCEQTVTWIGSYLLCWPMKLTFVCNVMNVVGGEDVCDPSKAMTSGFGEGYNYLLRSKDMLTSELQGGSLTYHVKPPPLRLDVRNADDTAKAIMKEFEQKKRFVDMVLLFLKRALALVIIRIVYNAQDYHDKFLKNIEFENAYITKYFKRIDARRHKNNKHTLLPLKKIEKPNFVDPLQVNLSRKEMKDVIVQSLKICLEILTATTIIIIDRLFYETLDLVQRHSVIQYYQTGSHDLTITVKGTGMIASIVKSVVKGFNFHKQINETHSNAECLPHPTAVSNKYLRKIYLMYIILILMVIFEGYARRLKWLITSYFYPKREKKRVLYLYNETLKKRKSYFKYMKSKVNKMIKENKLTQDISILLMLRLKYPNTFAWLTIFNLARRKCLICGNPEPRSQKYRERIRECPTCLYIFCLECWHDIDQICIVCNPPKEMDSDTEDDHEQSFGADDDNIE